MSNPATGRRPDDHSWLLNYDGPTFSEPPSFVSTPADRLTTLSSWANDYLQHRRALHQTSINDLQAEEDRKIFEAINAAMTDEQKEEGRMINLRNARKIKSAIFELEIE